MDADAIVVGAGCIGASVAKHLAEAGHDVLVLEKEARVAMHQSGRNSGVIHAGYNLEPGSAKARYCVEGSAKMRTYCRERGVAVEQGGILVAATQEAQVPVVRDLLDRGRANGVAVRHVDAQGIRELEPHARGIEALHAPEGASVDAAGYVDALRADAEASGARFRFQAPVRGPLVAGRVRIRGQTLRARVAVNAAGLHADRLAGDLAEDVRVVPFRGSYVALPQGREHLVRSHIYGAPDPRFPFLGVHASRRVDGTVTLGPGAMLAFGREAYRAWHVQTRDLAGMLAWPGFWRLLGSKAFRQQVHREFRKSMSKRAIAREAQGLVPAMPVQGLRRFRAGNRAQMVRRDGGLVEDILVRETEDTVHVLNAVSPGLTCSLPFGRDVAERAAGMM